MSNIFGCYISVAMPLPDADPLIIHEAKMQGQLFRDYIFNENGIAEIIKILNYEYYGDDLKLALFQFYVNPEPLTTQALMNIEPYRKKEKSIGMPIIVNNENFFSKSDQERFGFLRDAVFQKLGLLAEVVTKKKLDTKIDRLKADLQKLLA